MNINDLMCEKGITKYRLSKESGIPYSTINDICSEKVSIMKCSVDTMYKICKVLDTSMDELVREFHAEQLKNEYRHDFEIFKSNVCHMVKDKGDLQFILETLESDQIGQYYRMKWYAECLYLLGMVDYLSRENNLPQCAEYEELRKCRLTNTLYPAGVTISAEVLGDKKIKEDALRNAIPEFKRFNIVENEVRNVI